MKQLSFKRCILPLEAESDPALIMFSDASERVYRTCAYARWELSNEKFEIRIIAAKSTIEPMKKISLVRLELDAVVMLKRLCKRLKFEKEIFIVDSVLLTRE